MNRLLAVETICHRQIMPAQLISAATCRLRKEISRRARHSHTMCRWSDNAEGITDKLDLTAEHSESTQSFKHCMTFSKPSCGTKPVRAMTFGPVETAPPKPTEKIQRDLDRHQRENSASTGRGRP